MCVCVYVRAILADSVNDNSAPASNRTVINSDPSAALLDNIELTSLCGQGVVPAITSVTGAFNRTQDCISTADILVFYTHAHCMLADGMAVLYVKISVE